MFHIGLAKTGTTTLQSLMAANASELDGRSIHYPPLLRRKPMAHHVLPRTLREEGPDAAPWALLRDLRDRAQAGTVLISAEGLSAVSPARVREAIGGEEARVIAYLRPFPSWIVSSYSQRAKWGGTAQSFDRFLAESGAGRVEFLADNVLRWAEVFGAGRVRLRSFDKAALEGGDIVDDFLAALGTSRDGLSVPASVNVTPDWRVVELVKERHARMLATSGVDFAATLPDRRRTLETALAAGERLGWATKGEYLTREQRRSLAETYVRHAERLRAAIPDCQIAEAKEPDRDRPFLPSPEAVSPSDRDAFDEAFRQSSPAAAVRAAERRTVAKARTALSRGSALVPAPLGRLARGLRGLRR